MNEILDEVRLTFDGDAFGTVESWGFALRDYLTFHLGEHVPDFRPAPSGPVEDDCAYQTLVELRPTRNEAWYALHVLDRAREIIRAEGMDY